MPGFQIVPLSGFTPAVGRIVDMMTYARHTLLGSVTGLSIADLDHHHDERSNSIGALLAHVAAVERYWQVQTFEDRVPTPEDEAAWMPALTLGEAGRHGLRGLDLNTYLVTLYEVRNNSLSRLAELDDEWFSRPLSSDPEVNPHWAWFHVMEDEINHRGQIRWLRSRLPSSGE